MNLSNLWPKSNFRCNSPQIITSSCLPQPTSRVFLNSSIQLSLSFQHFQRANVGIVSQIIKGDYYSVKKMSVLRLIEAHLSYIKWISYHLIVTEWSNGPRANAESVHRPVITTSAPWSRARFMAPALKKYTEFLKLKNFLEKINYH